MKNITMMKFQELRNVIGSFECIDFGLLEPEFKGGTANLPQEGYISSNGLFLRRTARRARGNGGGGEIWQGGKYSINQSSNQSFNHHSCGKKQQQDNRRLIFGPGDVEFFV